MALLPVQLEAVWVGKLLLTLAAPVRLLTCVRPDVLVEVVLAGEDGGAEGAFVRLLARVAVQVVLKGVCLEEATAALVAAEGLLDLRVPALHVRLQLAHAAVRLLALGAVVRLLAPVHQDVRLQGVPPQVHATVLALREPPPLVLLHVVPQGCLGQALEAALFAPEVVVVAVGLLLVPHQIPLQPIDGAAEVTLKAVIRLAFRSHVKVKRTACEVSLPAFAADKGAVIVSHVRLQLISFVKTFLTFGTSVRLVLLTDVAGSLILLLLFVAPSEADSKLPGVATPVLLQR